MIALIDANDLIYDPRKIGTCYGEKETKRSNNKSDKKDAAGKPPAGFVKRVFSNKKGEHFFETLEGAICQYYDIYSRTSQLSKKKKISDVEKK